MTLRQKIGYGLITDKEKNQKGTEGPFKGGIIKLPHEKIEIEYYTTKKGIKIDVKKTARKKHPDIMSC